MPGQHQLPPITDVFFTIDQAQFSVVKDDLWLQQPHEGLQPFGHPYLPPFWVLLKSIGDPLLFEWNADKLKKYSGSIDYYSHGALITQVSFEDAFCIGWRRQGDYTANAGTNMILESVNILPASLEWENINFPQE